MLPGIGSNVPHWFNRPLTHITPLSLSDGATYERKLDWVYRYIVDWIVPQLDGKLDEWFEQYKADHAALLKDIASEKTRWQQLFDAFMADVVSQLEALNDQAAANLVRSDSSKLREALNENFMQAVSEYTYYVNVTNGSDSNNGSQSSPFKTLNQAMKEVVKKTTKSDVSAKVYLSAGTYKERYVFPDFTPFNLNVEIIGAEVGGHPNTPITVFTEGDGAKAITIINRNPGVRWTVKDVMFNGYNGTASSGALNNNNGHLITDNVHVNRCYYGISSFAGRLNIPNGKISGCGYLFGGGGSGAGIRSMMLNRHSIGIQANGNRLSTLVIDDCYSGLFAQESSTGHLDWCTIKNCGRGVNLAVSSRANCDGTEFVACSTGINAGSNSHAYVSSNVVFTNTLTRVTCTGGAEYLAGTSVDYVGISSSGSRGLEIIDGVYKPETSTTSAEFFFRKKIIGEWFDDKFLISGTPVKRVCTRSLMRITGTEGQKFINVRHLGGATETTYGASESGVYEIVTEIYFMTSGKQLVFFKSTGNLLNPRVYVLEREAVLSGELDIAIQFRTENASDKMEVLFTEVSAVK